MRLLKNRRVLWTAGIMLLVVFSLLLLPRINPPAPDRHTYLIFPGRVSRAFVDEKFRRSGARRGGLSFPCLPHHLEFESTGTIDVYVVRVPSGSAKERIDEMTRLTEQLLDGRPPEAIVAKARGRRGRIDLHWWPYGVVSYLVLVRSEEQSEVEMVVHYGP